MSAVTSNDVLSEGIVSPSAKPEVSAKVSASGPMQELIGELTGGAVLGETDVGAAWCLKALHPADVNVLSCPMPSNETRSFASVGFNQMDAFSIPSTFQSTKTWSIDIFVLRDPCILYAYRMHQAGEADVTGFVYSKQYGMGPGQSYAECFQSVRQSMEKFRITSQSLTGYFDGASESDQGHVVLGQSDHPWMKVAATMLPAPTMDIAAQLPWVFYQDPRPGYENILQATRSYQGSARDGFYVPSKLQNIGRWCTTNQVNGMLGTHEAIMSDTTSLPFGNLGVGSFFAQDGHLKTTNTFPWMRKSASEEIPFVFDQMDSSITSIFYTGLSSTSTLRLTMRWTMDMMVRPGTIYAPFVRMPPVEDHLAFKMYAEVSRRMADGHPSRYNNLGAIIPLIGKVASAVFPTLSSFIPHVLQRRNADREYAMSRGLPAPSGLVDNALEYVSHAVNASAGKQAAEEAYYRAGHKVRANPDDPTAKEELSRASEAYRNSLKYDVAGTVGNIFRNFRSGGGRSGSFRRYSGRRFASRTYRRAGGFRRSYGSYGSYGRGRTYPRRRYYRRY